MEEKTSDEIAAIFSAAGDSVTVIGTAQTSDETDTEFKEKIQRNVEHLEIIKAYKKALKDLKLKTSYLVISEEKIKIEDFLKPFNKLMDSTRKGLSLQRYKGLGEMNPEQLWDTTMNPVGRRLVQVKIEDADEASDLFEQLMGDNVENRREFIETNASLIGNIDI